MGKTIDPGEQQVAWFPDEKAYRIVRHKTETVKLADGSEHSFEVAEPGALVTWVDDAPDDPEDGAGHFEQHGSGEYVSLKRAEE